MRAQFVRFGGMPDADPTAVEVPQPTSLVACVGNESVTGESQARECDGRGEVDRCMSKTIKVGDLVEVIEPQDSEGPPVGTRCRVLEIDGSRVPYRIEWGTHDYWMEDHEVSLASQPRCGGNSSIMTLLQGGWSVSAAASSFDGSSVLVWRHDDCDLTVEIGGGTVDLVGRTRSPDQFTPTELRAFAALAEETA